MFVCTQVHAGDVHQLWLKKQTAKAVDVKSNSKSPIAINAIKALKEGWQGSSNAQIKLSIVKDKAIKDDGFKLESHQIKANTPAGLLYGSYGRLRSQPTGYPLTLGISNPSYQHRILNHWDNLNGSVERGYGGKSIFWRGEND